MDHTVTVVPRGDGLPRDPGPLPGSARAAPTLLGTAWAVAVAVFRYPEAALVTAIVVALLGALAGWW